jgi:hypothetical protein
MDLSVNKDIFIVDQIRDGIGSNPSALVLDATYQSLIDNLDLRGFEIALVRIGITGWSGTTVIRIKSQNRIAGFELYEDIYTARPTTAEDELSYVTDKHLFEQAKIGTPTEINFLLQPGPIRDGRIVIKGAGGAIIERVTILPGTGL